MSIDNNSVPTVGKEFPKNRASADY